MERLKISFNNNRLNIEYSLDKLTEYAYSCPKKLKEFLKPYNFSVVREEHSICCVFYLWIENVNQEKWNTEFIENNIIPKINDYENHLRNEEINNNKKETYKFLHSQINNTHSLITNRFGTPESKKLAIKRQELLNEVEKNNNQIAKINLIEIHKKILLNEFDILEKDKSNLEIAFNKTLDLLNLKEKD